MTKKPHRIPPMHMNPDLPAPPDVELVEGQEHYMINRCSGHTIWHIPECDESCGTELITEDDVKIRNELNAWIRLGAEPNMIPHNVFNMDIQLFTAIRVMIEILGVDEEEFNARFKTNLLEKLVTTRKANEVNFRKMRAMKDITVPGRPGIIGPNGTPLQ